MMINKKVLFTTLFTLSYVFGLLFTLSTCGLVSSRPPDRVYIITIDTLRRDRVGVYNENKNLTSFLDRMGGEGFVFENAFTPVPITLPAHTSIMTGLWPHHHGVRSNVTFRLNEEIPTLAEAMQQKGYYTEAFVAAYVLNSRFGLARGFQRYVDFIPAAMDNPNEVAQIHGEEQNRRVGQGLEELTHHPRTFVWVHYYDPHAPYGPPPPYNVPSALPGPDRYDADVRYTDQRLEELWEKLHSQGLLKRAMVWFVADHGEAFYEHGSQGHGHFLYNETVQIPMILWLSPELRASLRANPGRIRWPVSLTDITPTVLDMIKGYKRGMRLDGISLLPYLRNKFQAQPRVLLAESLLPALDLGVAPLFAGIEFPWKYIQAPRSELYNLEKDRGEKVNILSGEKNRRDPILARLRARTRHVIQKTLETYQELNPKLDVQAREQLASLGYIGTALDTKIWHWDRDAKDYLDAFNVMNRVLSEANQGRVNEGIRILENTLADLPEYSLQLHKVLASIYSQVGRTEDAIQTYEELLRRSPDDADIALRIGRLYQDLGSTEQALEWYRKSLQIEPFETAYYLLAHNLMKLNRVDEADQVLREAIQKYPDSPGLLVIRGAERIARRRFPEAINILRRSLDLYPGNTTAWAYLAVAYLGAGERKKALETFTYARNKDKNNGIVRELEPYFLALEHQSKSQN